jgi:hypothetical protein
MMGNAVKVRWKLYDRVQKKLDLILSIEERAVTCGRQEDGAGLEVDLRLDYKGIQTSVLCLYVACS